MNKGAKCGHKCPWSTPRQRRKSQTMVGSEAGRFWVLVPPNKCRHIQCSRPCSAPKCQFADCRSENSYNEIRKFKLNFINNSNIFKWTVRRRGWMLISIMNTQIGQFKNFKLYFKHYLFQIIFIYLQAIELNTHLELSQKAW